MVLCCSQEKETVVLLFSGEGNMCSTAQVFRRRGLVLYCSREKSLSVYLDKNFHTDNGLPTR